MKLTCKKCCVEKPKTEFYKAKGTKTGFHSSCKVCYKARVRAYKEAKADMIPKESRAYYEKNKEAILEKNKKYAEARPEIGKKAKKSWKIRNAYRVTAMTAKRRAAKLKATPDWLTERHLTEISEFYWLAKDLKAVSGQTYHVDHIIPLQGKDVCGLHVPWNLQVLPDNINLSKSNKVST